MPPRRRPTAYEVSFGTEPTPSSSSSSTTTLVRDDSSGIARGGHNAGGNSNGRPGIESGRNPGRVNAVASTSALPELRRPKDWAVGGRTGSSSSARGGSNSERRRARSRSREDGSDDQVDIRRRRLRYDDDTYLTETADTLLWDEEPVSPSPSRSAPAPPLRIRFLTDFYISDPHDRENYVALDVLPVSEHDASSGQYEARGSASALCREDEEALDDALGDGKGETQRLRTSGVVKFSVDYLEQNGPVILQTQHALYILGEPTARYRPAYMASYRPHRLAQLLVSRAAECPAEKYQEFKRDWLGWYDDVADTRITEQLFADAAPVVFGLLKVPDEDLRAAVKSTLIREYLIAIGYRAKDIDARILAAPIPSSSSTASSSRKIKNRKRRIDRDPSAEEDPKYWCVTPRVFEMAQGLFPGKFKLLSPTSGSAKTKADPKAERKVKRQKRKQLVECLQRARDSMGAHVRFEERLRDRKGDWVDAVYWGAVTVGGQTYKVGDCVLVTAGQWSRPSQWSDLGRKMQRIPDVVNDDTVPQDRILADYFWFGRIKFIREAGRSGLKEVHVQWFEHGSKTFLQEQYDQQELFIVSHCDSFEPRAIVGKVQVLHFPTYEDRLQKRAIVPPLAFFYSFEQPDYSKGAFFVEATQNVFRSTNPGGNHCEMCDKQQSRVFAQSDDILEDTDGNPIVLIHAEAVYHRHDFVMIRSDPATSKVCSFGQIERIKTVRASRGSERRIVLLVRLLGRINDVREAVCPDELKDERHLFFTDMVQDVPSEDIVGPCRVRNANTMSPEALRTWLELSPYNLFVKFHWPDLDATDPEARTVLSGRRAKQIPYCSVCSEADETKERLRHEFVHTRRIGGLQPLRTLDLFSGVGAFSHAMQETGSLELTHAVEINPSASKTLLMNSPKTIVYNQTANSALEYAIKRYRGVDNEAPKVISGEGRLPPPPRPEEIECIVAGFPCDPHSLLDMYRLEQRAVGQSRNVLTLLSWVEFLQPDYCFCENVPGMLSWIVEKHEESGKTKRIEQVGAKLLVRAFLERGYQVRFGLLQAAHFGTPQTRRRFFLVAAKLGLPLPAFPQPVYAFPTAGLKIRFPLGIVLELDPLVKGTLPYHSVSVEDAISDLPLFDWCEPRKKDERPRKDPETRELVPLLKGDKSKGHMCGPRTTAYRHEPRTMYQKTARSLTDRDVNDQSATVGLQHFTPTYQSDTVSRVINIPLKPRADYRALFDPKLSHLWQYQFSDPKSAIARLHFRRGMYGRLDKDEWFQTIVGNVGPTAKQSWVLHPSCKRVLTVRELARAQGFPDHFQFCSAPELKGSTLQVTTIHKQIGNAVAWPVGRALGHELKEAMFMRWLGKQNGEEAKSLLDPWYWYVDGELVLRGINDE